MINYPPPTAITPGQAAKLLRNAGARVRMTGGGLIEDPQPQIEAKHGDDNWSYVTDLPEGEASLECVLWWIELNTKKKASRN